VILGLGEIDAPAIVSPALSVRGARSASPPARPHHPIPTEPGRPNIRRPAGTGPGSTPIGPARPDRGSHPVGHRAAGRAGSDPLHDSRRRWDDQRRRNEYRPVS
jgi:hypothetical protein